MIRSSRQLFALAQEALRTGDGRAALKLARQGSAGIADPFQREFALAAIEVDAGALLNDRSVLRRAMSRMEAIRGIATTDSLARYTYNLGNAYLALGEREAGRSAGTRPSLAKAISCLEESLAIRESPESRANLGSALLSQGRWVEALDEFSTVLQACPAHHNALAMHGSALIGLANWSRGHRGLLVAALNDHIRAAELAEHEPVYRASYLKVVERLRAKHLPRTPKPQKASTTARWIWANRLNLNLCPICETEAPDAFDSYPLQGPILLKRHRPTSDELMDIVNSLCRSYGAGRWALLRGLRVVPLEKSDQIVSVASASPALHDTGTALVLVAVTQFYGVFQQVAYALSRYLQLGHPETSITFDRVWWPVKSRGRGVPSNRAGLHSRIRRAPCPALSALHHLALSMQFGMGKYSALRELRNHLEHHIVLPVVAPHRSRYYYSYPVDDLQDSAVQLGRLARAAIWYFSGSVLHFEGQRARRAANSGRPALVVPGGAVERM